MKEKVVLVIMDGIGVNDNLEESAVKKAYTPTLDYLMNDCPNIHLKAHGTAVGLPSDEDMGNSEVGHNALGCGQIYSQGAKLVEEAIKNNRLFASETWGNLVSNCIMHATTLHFIGLLSDGNVHSNIAHLIEMIKRAKEEGVHNVRCHIMLDGRDVPALSALKYVDQLEECLRELNDDTFCGKIASGGGRMAITMDRYQANWQMVKRGWDAHVHGIGRQFQTATDAIQTYRNELNVIDQDLPEFIICENGVPVGKIEDHDSVVFYNFRGDRAIELSMAFENREFNHFDRGVVPNVIYAGMLQYDGDLNLPKMFLVSPPEITHTLTDLLNENNLFSLAVSETQKYGHVTYFWNGNRSEKANDYLEDWIEIKSDIVPFEQRPWMKAAEITDKVIEGMNSGKYQFIRCNYPNGDMVGHTGSMQATLIAVECVDWCLSRILQAADLYGYTVIVTADHGNADQMYEMNKNGEYQVRTAHSLNPVPFTIYNMHKHFELSQDVEYGLANVAGTIAELMGIHPYEMWESSMLVRHGD